MVGACSMGGTYDAEVMAMIPRLDRRLVLTGGALLALGGLVASAPAQATWTSGTSSDGTGWSIRNGNVKNGAVEIEMPDQKTADRTADRLNKAEDKAEKRAEKDEQRNADSDQQD